MDTTARRSTEVHFGLAWNWQFDQDFVNQIGNINISRLGATNPSHLDQWTYTYKDVAIAAGIHPVTLSNLLNRNFTATGGGNGQKTAGSGR